jgi:glycerol uptake facilitator-like aquaporin
MCTTGSVARGKECVVLSKLSAEFLGTFWLVLGGCGTAVLAATFPEVGIGLLGVSFAFGLTVVTGAYALGPISEVTSTPRSRSGCGLEAAFPPPCWRRTPWRRSSAASPAPPFCM